MGRQPQHGLACKLSNPWALALSHSGLLFLLLMQVLLFHDQNYGIHYEYTIPVNYTTENQSEPEKPQDSLFIWTHSGWEGCSVQCGGGEQQGWGYWVWGFTKQRRSEFRALRGECTLTGKG